MPARQLDIIYLRLYLSFITVIDTDINLSVNVIKRFEKYNSVTNFPKMISIASLHNHRQSGFRNLMLLCLNIYLPLYTIDVYKNVQRKIREKQSLGFQASLCVTDTSLHSCTVPMVLLSFGNSENKRCVHVYS